MNKVEFPVTAPTQSGTLHAHISTLTVHTHHNIEGHPWKEGGSAQQPPQRRQIGGKGLTVATFCPLPAAALPDPLSRRELSDLDSDDVFPASSDCGVTSRPL